MASSIQSVYLMCPDVVSENYVHVRNTSQRRFPSDKRFASFRHVPGDVEAVIAPNLFHTEEFEAAGLPYVYNIATLDIKSHMAICRTIAEGYDFPFGCIRGTIIRGHRDNTVFFVRLGVSKEKHAVEFAMQFPLISIEELLKY